MRRIFLALFAFALLLSAMLTAQSAPSQPTITVSQIHAGMRGVAYTVFEGIKPEPMDVEVLGVLRNVNGPKGDIILVRLHGPKVEYTGVVAGMSGSPVYLGGKIARALRVRIRRISKRTNPRIHPHRQNPQNNRSGPSPRGETPRH